MNWLQQLLNDPALRAGIGWLAAGFASLASGIWVVARFYLERRLRMNKPPDAAKSFRIDQKITASGNAIAAGRDANIGVKGLHVVVLILLLVATLLFGLSAFGDHFVRSAVGEASPIPEFSLSLTCGSTDAKNPYQLSVEEKNNLVDFVDFIEQNHDKAVYVSVRIDKECAACGCPRARQEDPDHPLDFVKPYIGALHIDGRNVQERKKYFSGWGTKMNLEGVELMAFAPDDWAVSHSIFLPRPEHLSESQYRSGEYGTFARFDGLFTARYFGGTGGNALQLDIIRPSDRQEAQLRCIRERGNLSSRQRLYLGC